MKHGTSVNSIRLFRSPIVLLFSLLLTSHASAIFWGQIGPENVQVNDYVGTLIDDYTEFLLTDEGVWVSTDMEEYVLMENTPDLPAIAAWYPWDDATVLMAFGDRTDSDGIYRYPTEENGFELLAYAMRPRFFAEIGDGLYLGYEEGLTYSEDFETWTDLDVFSGQSVLAMTAYGSRLIVTTATDGGRIYFSTDGGENWIVSDGDNKPFVALMPGPDGALYASLPGESEESGLWKSVDSGDSWTLIYASYGLVDLTRAYNLLICGWDGEDGHMEGVKAYRPSDGVFQGMNDDLPSRTVNMFSYMLVNCVNVVVCTEAGAYETCEFPSDASVAEPAAIPGTFGLAVHPNPFNTMTTIELELKRQDYVTVTLFDMLGRNVKTLDMGKALPGRHRLALDGSELSAGMYVVRVQGTTAFEARKVVLLK
ncbi:T9SS type A sorting domain-containing protein [bacterium]|nr:T9SS type A sorting domain-containing protein [bacterium]